MRSSDLAVALLAGLLQRLGAQHRNEAMIDAGKRLAEHITRTEAGAPNQGRGRVLLAMAGDKPAEPDQQGEGLGGRADPVRPLRLTQC